MITKEAAQRIRETMQTAGWADIMGILTEISGDARGQLIGIIARKPDTLTGKTAIRLASRSAALTDFREEVEGALKLLDPQPGRAGR